MNTPAALRRENPPPLGERLTWTLPDAAKLKAIREQVQESLRGLRLESDE